MELELSWRVRLGRECIRCGEMRRSAMVNSRGRKDGHIAECLACHRRRAAENYKKRPEKYKRSAQAWRARNPGRRHGVTPERWEQMFNLYAGRCHVCRVGEAKVVDHDHRCCPGDYGCSSCVRGLLCSACNTGIGLLKENVQTLRSAIEYLDMRAG